MYFTFTAGAGTLADNNPFIDQMEGKFRAVIEVRKATDEELPLVYDLMLRAFEEFRGALDPPSAALTESLEDVQAIVRRGGAILAFLDGEITGAPRYEIMEDHVYC